MGGFWGRLLFRSRRLLSLSLDWVYKLGLTILDGSRPCILMFYSEGFLGRKHYTIPFQYKIVQNTYSILINRLYTSLL